MENEKLNDPEIDRTIHLLEYELDSRHSEEKRHGWTTWAIVGAIVSSLWLMFPVIEQTDSLSWHNILYIFILFTLSFDLIFLLIKLLSSTIPKDFRNEARFFRLDTSLTNFILLLLLRTLLLLILINQLSPVLTGLIKFSCWLFLLFSLIILAFAFIAAIFQIPLADNPKPISKAKWVFYISRIIWIIPGFVGTTGLIKIVYVKTIVLSIPEWRIGVILFSTSILLLMLSKYKSKSILLVQLDDIRRKLSLGQIDLNRAKKAADLILNGLTVGNILQPKINNYIISLNNYNNLYEKYEPTLEIIEKLIETPEEEWNKDDEAIYDAIESLSEMVEDATLALKMILKNKAKFDRRAAFINGMSIEIEPAIEKFTNTIYQKNEKLLNGTTKFQERWNRLKDKYDKRVKAIPKQLAD